MNHNIHPCLWFDGKAKEAAELYCSIFDNSKIHADTPMVMKFEIAGLTLMGLNGGPMFKINPSISLFVTCETAAELDGIYDKLIAGGKAMMAVDKYPWSERYAWVADKFGMTWQLMLGTLENKAEKIVPSFLFTGSKYGMAEKAIRYYTELFPSSSIVSLEQYDNGEAQPKGYLKFGRFNLNGKSFVAMDGPGEHAFEFNEGVSLVAECDTQEEIDLYWNSLSKGGNESMCGWLKDQFGVSWQIVPKILGQLMMDQEKAPRVMQKFTKMRKLQIDELVNA